jgi:hypothetical protein
VDASLRLARQRYLQLVALAGAALLPYIALLVIVGSDPQNPAKMLPVFLAQILCTAVAEAATIVAVSDAYLAGEPRVGAALGTTIRRIGAVIGASIVRWMFAGLVMGILVSVLSATFMALAGSRGAMIGLALGVLLSLVPMIYILLRTFAVTAVLMLERTSVFRALTRSWELAKGSVGRIFFTLLLTWCIYFALVLLITAVAALVAPRNPTLSSVFTAIVLAFVYPFIGVVTTLLYYDLRVRREGFDLEIMARELGVPQTQGV